MGRRDEQCGAAGVGCQQARPDPVGCLGASDVDGARTGPQRGGVSRWGAVTAYVVSPGLARGKGGRSDAQTWSRPCGEVETRRSAETPVGTEGQVSRAALARRRDLDGAGAGKSIRTERRRSDIAPDDSSARRGPSRGGMSG